MAPFVHSASMAFLFAAVYGFGFGARNPLTTSIRGDYFGQKAFATITGLSMTPLYLFMLGGPIFAAVMYDINESYKLPFIVLAALSSLSGVLFLMAKKPVPVDSVQSTGEASGRV